MPFTLWHVRLSTDNKDSRTVQAGIYTVYGLHCCRGQRFNPTVHTMFPRPKIILKSSYLAFGKYDDFGSNFDRENIML